jgi:hypothetical protein
MVGARPVRHRRLWLLVPVTVLGLLLAASLITATGVAAQSLWWYRNPDAGRLAVWIGTRLARRHVAVLPVAAIVEDAESQALRDIDLQRTFK